MWPKMSLVLKLRNCAVECSSLNCDNCFPVVPFTCSSVPWVFCDLLKFELQSD